MSWSIYVNHYEDPKQAYRDSKYTWQQKNGSLYVGIDPPEDAKPLGIYYPRAGTLGGCSQHNAMNLVLPPDSTWDDIATLTGDGSWNATNMRLYFERIEKCNYLPEGTPGHGFSGWLGVSVQMCLEYTRINTVQSNQNRVDLLDSGLLEIARTALNVTGVETAEDDDKVLELLQRDMNRNDAKRYHQGAQLLPLHVDGRRRRSSSQTYLTDTINNLKSDGSQKYPLTISTSSLVTKLIFDIAEPKNNTTTKPRAIGVEYLQGSALYKADRRFDGTQKGVPMTAYASREVIVAGGVFNTPQILKLSGIGPREELESFNITVVVDLPAVGTNLQDNYEVGVEATASTDFGNIVANCTFLAPGDICLREWDQNATGPYTAGGAPLSILTRSSVSENNDTDLLWFGGGASIFRGYFPGFSRLVVPLSTFWWSIVKMQSQNRAGTVKLRSADPQDVPEINFNFFSQGGEHDIEALIEAVMLARKIFNVTSGPLAPFNVTEPHLSDVGQNIKDEAWGHHASCSCPIGPVGDAKACVDSEFRVQGVENLRIVDGSVFPRVPGGFPVLPTFLLSEKATHLILGDEY